MLLWTDDAAAGLIMELHNLNLMFSNQIVNPRTCAIEYLAALVRFLERSGAFELVAIPAGTMNQLMFCDLPPIRPDNLRRLRPRSKWQPRVITGGDLPK